MKFRLLFAAATLLGAVTVPAAAQLATPSMQADLRYSYCGIGDNVRVQ